MIVVADATAINYLVLIGHEVILHQLWGQVVLPEAVRDELKSSGAPNPVRLWVSSGPQWLEIKRPSLRPDATLAHLDDGERDAILLAEELRPDALIIDERVGGKRRRNEGCRYWKLLLLYSRLGLKGLSASAQR